MFESVRSIPLNLFHYCDLYYAWLFSYLLAEPEVSTPVMRKSAIKHDPWSISSIFHPHKLFP